MEMLPHLLPAEDEASSKLLERAFRRRGIGYKLGTRFESVKDTATGVTVTLAGGETLDAELLLVAVGRGPVSAGLGYDEVGVAMDRGFVLVDEYCQTSIPTISAVGDLTPGPAARARRLRRGHPGRRAAGRAAGDPDQLRRRAAGHLQRPRRSPRSASPRPPRPSAASRPPSSPTTWPGTARARSCRPRARLRSSRPRAGGPVLGIHLVGARVGELIAEAQLIYNWEAVPGRRRPAHPPAPDPVGGDRRGAPGAGRKAAARARITPCSLEGAGRAPGPDAGICGKRTQRRSCGKQCRSPYRCPS